MFCISSGAAGGRAEGGLCPRASRLELGRQTPNGGPPVWLGQDLGWMGRVHSPYWDTVVVRLGAGDVLEPSGDQLYPCSATFHLCDPRQGT